MSSDSVSVRCITRPDKHGMRLSLQPGGLGAIEAVRDSDSNLIVAASGPGIEKAGLLVPVTCIRLGHRALANSSAPLPKLVVLKRLREENAAVRFISRS